LPEENKDLPSKGLAYTFRALKYRNFRLFFMGQGVSLIGTWMQQTAMGWLVYRMTKSAILLGSVEFFGTIPTLLLTPFAGVLADRWNRHKMVIVVQTLAMIQAFLLAILVLAGHIQVWHIMTLSLMLGLINTFDIPIRQAFIMDMLEKKEDIGNAIALNSSMFNGARIIGPSVAGVLIAVFGEGWCFLLNGVSFLAVIVALLAMKMQRTQKPPSQQHVFREIMHGFSYTFGSIPIRSILLLLGLVSLVGLPYAVLMPVMVRNVLHGDSRTLGLLMASVGIGALTGAYYLASRASTRGLEKTIALGCFMFSLGLISFSFSRRMPISMIILVLSGFGIMVHMASTNTLVQTLSDEDKRGRVLSYYTLAFRGTGPFGAFMAGALTDKIGAPHTILIGGICCLAGAIVYAWKLPKLQKMIQQI
jgi:MFS family permease